MSKFVESMGRELTEKLVESEHTDQLAKEIGHLWEDLTQLVRSAQNDFWKFARYNQNDPKVDPVLKDVLSRLRKAHEIIGSLDHELGTRARR